MPLRTATLPDAPGPGDDFEDFIAALFQASGHFVEKQVTQSDPTDVLELDIVASDYATSPISRRLVEVKGGGWGYPDAFKVIGWMHYLEFEHSALFVKEWDGHEDAPGRLAPLGLDVHCIDDFGTAPESFHAAGFGRPTDQGLIALWRYSYQVERRLIKLINAKAKAGSAGAAAAKKYRRLINDGTFFARQPEESLALLYEAYMEHPRLTLGYALELDGGTYHPDPPTTDSPSLKSAIYSGLLPELQGCMYLEHRARLAILKAAVDYAMAHPDGPPPMISEDGEGTWKFRDLTYHMLPGSFQKGMSWLRQQRTFHLYPVLWQQFLWAWGGFILENRENEEHKWMAAESGVPVDEVPTALEAFDKFFAIDSGWFVTAGRTDVRTLRMMPTVFRGIGAHHRRQQYALGADLAALNVDAPYTRQDMSVAINTTVDLLLS